MSFKFKPLAIIAWVIVVVVFVGFVALQQLVYNLLVTYVGTWAGALEILILAAWFVYDVVHTRLRSKRWHKSRAGHLALQAIELLEHYREDTRRIMRLEGFQVSISGRGTLGRLLARHIACILTIYDTEDTWLTSRVFVTHCHYYLNPRATSVGKFLRVEVTDVEGHVLSSSTSSPAKPAHNRRGTRRLNRQFEEIADEHDLELLLTYLGKLGGALETAQ